jgi:hypothetical protein
VDLGLTDLGFELRYNLGLTDINDIIGSTVDIKNRVFSVLVGISFGVG